MADGVNPGGPTGGAVRDLIATALYDELWKPHDGGERHPDYFAECEAHADRVLEMFRTEGLVIGRYEADPTMKARGAFVRVFVPVGEDS